jgi:hypothetical protein
MTTCTHLYVHLVFIGAKNVPNQSYREELKCIFYA